MRPRISSVCPVTQAAINHLVEAVRRKVVGLRLEPQGRAEHRTGAVCRHRPVGRLPRRVEGLFGSGVTRRPATEGRGPGYLMTRTPATTAVCYCSWLAASR